MNDVQQFLTQISPLPNLTRLKDCRQWLWREYIAIITPTTLCSPFLPSLRHAEMNTVTALPSNALVTPALPSGSLLISKLEQQGTPSCTRIASPEPLYHSPLYHLRRRRNDKTDWGPEIVKISPLPQERPLLSYYETAQWTIPNAKNYLWNFTLQYQPVSAGRSWTTITENMKTCTFFFAL